MRDCDYFSDFFKKNVLTEYFKQIENKRTQNEYYNACALLCEYCKKDFLRITEEDVSRYIEYLIGGEISRKTIKTRLSYYRSIEKFIMERFELLENAPFSNTPLPYINSNTNISRIPSLKEMDKLFTTAKDDEQFCLILTLASRAALSATEIVSIKKKMVIIAKDNVLLRYNSKTEEKLVSLPEDAKRKILCFLATRPMEPEEYIFKNTKGKPLSRRMLDYTLRKYIQAAGIETHFSLKDLRNRAAMELIKAGVSDNVLQDYTGIGRVQANQLRKASTVLVDCPANLVNYRVV